MALIFKLSGLSCQHCVNQVEQALTSLVEPEQFKLSTQYLVVKADISAQNIMEAIEKVGYQAEVAQADHVLALEGLSCGHCVARVEKALIAVAQVFWVEVEKTVAQIYGLAERTALIEAVEKAGYHAK
ncbi:copper-transporting ATPase [Mergibacter septicus]|uniref:cation transporter n=1 Tax=Mergibacter septicus TaxID=221402 RepID=UPI001C766616|nr:cation transporter [Mergibacter septicus]QDJ12485.1 copper-transporting ATPase [Mergibacter septicus]